MLTSQYTCLPWMPISNKLFTLWRRRRRKNRNSLDNPIERQQRPIDNNNKRGKTNHRILVGSIKRKMEFANVNPKSNVVFFSPAHSKDSHEMRKQDEEKKSEKKKTHNKIGDCANDNASFHITCPFAAIFVKRKMRYCVGSSLFIVAKDFSSIFRTFLLLLVVSFYVFFFFILSFEKCAFFFHSFDGACMCIRIR